MLRYLPFALMLSAGPVFAQPGVGASSTLSGHVEGNVYVAPSGSYRVTIPVLPELGGAITDTAMVVTFQDHFNLHVSIGAFPMDATQRWECSTRGVKNYLIYFVDNFVMPDFRHMFPGTRIESSRFLSEVMNGSLLTYTLLPGGSMFGDQHAVLGADDTPPVAKRGNLVFVRNNTVFILSTELAERVIERSSYKKTTAEEDEILRLRLADTLRKIEFTKPAAD